MLLGALVLWYLGAIWMNAAGAIERVLPSDAPWTWQQLVAATMDMQRPVVPTPHQVAFDFWSSLVDWPLDSPRNLLFHVAVTAESTLWGFVLGTALGLVLAVLIVHSRTLDKALLPWIVASQTVPVLAIAPIVLVILGSLGFSGVCHDIGIDTVSRRSHQLREQRYVDEPESGVRHFHAGRAERRRDQRLTEAAGFRQSRLDGLRYLPGVEHCVPTVLRVAGPSKRKPKWSMSSLNVSATIPANSSVYMER